MTKVNRTAFVCYLITLTKVNQTVSVFYLIKMTVYRLISDSCWSDIHEKKNYGYKFLSDKGTRLKQRDVSQMELVAAGGTVTVVEVPQRINKMTHLNNIPIVYFVNYSK